MRATSNQTSKDRLSKMREARSVPAVILQEHNKFRSSHPNKLMMAVEGDSDCIFYQTMVSKYTSNLDSICFPCSGKKAVLSLRKSLKESKVNAEKICFFVDHDFDGIGDHAPSFDLYCTPTYSIENIMVSKTVLQSLLKTELKCNDHNADKDVDSVCERFEKLLNQYFDAMKEVNLLIFVSRKKGVSISLRDKKINKFISVSVEEIKNLNQAKILLNDNSLITNKDMETWQDDFETLKPLENWRGKYLLDFFLKFLKLVAKDRNSENPSLFVEKKNVSFDPYPNSIRLLASICEAPQCLIDFLKNS